MATQVYMNFVGCFLDIGPGLDWECGSWHCMDGLSRSPSSETYEPAFVVVVKTVPKEYPKKFLSEIELTARDDHFRLVSDENSDCKPMFFMWMDWERRSFISSTETTNPAAQHVRECWGTVTDQAEKLDLEIPLAEFVSTNYKTCSRADRHSQCKQDDFRIEKTLDTNDCSASEYFPAWDDHRWRLASQHGRYGSSFLHKAKPILFQVCRWLNRQHLRQSLNERGSWTSRGRGYKFMGCWCWDIFETNEEKDEDRRRRKLKDKDVNDIQISQIWQKI